MKKVLIFAHKPPPHHGQSYMVQLLVEGLGADTGSAVQLFHVDVRLSHTIDEIGQAGLGKLRRLVGFCWQAIRLRFGEGVKCFYYIPAPGLRAAVYRDWVVMALCRPFFSRRVYHWQAMGLGEWIEQTARPWERWISRWLLRGPALSIVLGEPNRQDATLLRSERVVVIPNGIPDPCPNFATEVLPVRMERAAARAAVRAGGGEVEFRALFIGLCHREKGLWDAVEAVALANRSLAGTGLRVSLSVAGGFWNEADRAEFEQLIRRDDLQRAGEPLVKYLGFVSGEAKRRLFAESDGLCFPTYYWAESFGIVVVEAMAWGLHVVTTRWRAVPELLPANYPGVVSIQSPTDVAEQLKAMARAPYNPELRERYLARYTAAQYARSVEAALRSVT